MNRREALKLLAGVIPATALAINSLDWLTCPAKPEERAWMVYPPWLLPYLESLSYYTPISHNKEFKRAVLTGYLYENMATYKHPYIDNTLWIGKKGEGCILCLDVKEDPMTNGALYRIAHVYGSYTHIKDDGMWRIIS
jgi:hypothetical protein